MQLQPHFLFNTLGAIIVLIQQQKTPQAEAMVARLADLLRLTLDDVDAQEVPLWRELEFLRSISRSSRFGSRTGCVCRLQPMPTVSDALVPHLVLQPIVENAVRHGLGQSEEAVTIDVSAAAGTARCARSSPTMGPACRRSNRADRDRPRNTRNRLARLYAEDASLLVEYATPRGVRVIDPLPLRWRHGRRAMRLKVLVVDDEPLARDGLKLLLGRQAASSP